MEQIKRFLQVSINLIQITGTGASVQPYKYNGMEFIEMHGYDVSDLGWRGLHHAKFRFDLMDRFSEKFPWQSPYVIAGNNPINFVDVMGDSITLAGNSAQESIMALYNGIADGTKISMKFNNGVLDPSSIADQAKNTPDLFLKDIYEVATNSTMVELSMSKINTYVLNNQKITKEFEMTPYDYDIRMESLETQKQLISIGEIPGKTIQGNLGQTLFPKLINASGKRSTNNNVQVIINGKGKLNHRTVGIAHEFGHLVLYLRGLPYGHGQLGVDDFIYNRSTNMLKKLGYDY